MADELIDIINKNNEVIGQELKSTAHEQGLRHRVSAVLLENTEGKYLLPTASDSKVEAGGLFHSAAGHVTAGESYKQAARRETQEEIGLTIETEALISIGSFWLEKERFEVYLVMYDDKMGKVKLNEEQIHEQWISWSEFQKIYETQPDKLSYPLKLSCENLLSHYF